MCNLTCNLHILITTQKLLCLFLNDDLCLSSSVSCFSLLFLVLGVTTKHFSLRHQIQTCLNWIFVKCVVVCWCISCFTRFHACVSSQNTATANVIGLSPRNLIQLYICRRMYSQQSIRSDYKCWIVAESNTNNENMVWFHENPENLNLKQKANGRCSDDI